MKDLPYLKACPFCGHDLNNDDPRDIVHPKTRDGKVWVVDCAVGNGGCDASVLGDSAEDACEHWNRRAS